MITDQVPFGDIKDCDFGKTVVIHEALLFTFLNTDLIVNRQLLIINEKCSRKNFYQI